MTRSARLLLCLVGATAATAPCAAEVRVSFPLEGYYRVGRYMPVRVVVRGEGAGPLTLAADGAVPVTLQLSGGGADGIVPLLVVREPFGGLRWSLPDGRAGSVEASLVPLRDHERLVGYSGGTAAAALASATPLLENLSLVPVPLGLSLPLPGMTVMWEALDAVVLDNPPSAYRLPFLAPSTTAVIVRTAQEPSGAAEPFRRQGDTWVAERIPTGPVGAIAPEAYGPVYGWKVGRPAELRRRVVLLGVLFMILAMAASLWKARLAAGVLVILSILVTAGFDVWSSRQSPVASVDGLVVVRTGSDRFHADGWTYFKSLAPATATFPAVRDAKPVFASSRHFERSGARLECQANGDVLWFSFALGPDTAVAFRTSERYWPSDNPPPDPAARGSPLWPLVREAYLRRGARAAGEVPAGPVHGPGEGPPQHWPGIVIDLLP